MVPSRRPSPKIWREPLKPMGGPVPCLPGDCGEPMQRLLVMNIFISLLWPILNGDYALRALFIGFLLGFLLISIVQRKYGRYAWLAARFVGYVVYAILVSNLRLAAIIISKTFGAASELRPGIVAVPLTLTNPFDITILATLITLTPGTLSVDLGEDVSGKLWPYGESEEGMIGQEAAPGTDKETESDADSLKQYQIAPGRERGSAALLVHAIDVADPKGFRAEIKEKFEGPLLELRRILFELEVADL